MTIAQAMQQAATHQQAGRNSEAEDLYRQILAQTPDNAHALNYLGLVLQQTGRGQEALPLMIRSVEVDPSVLHFHTNLAGVLRAHGNPEAAIEAAQHAVGMEERSGAALLELGAAQVAAGRNEEAIVTLQKLLAMEPKWAPAHSHLGHAYQSLGRLGEAAAAFNRAAELQPKEAGHMVNLGNSLRNALDFHGASAMYARAIVLDPRNAAAHYNLGLARLTLGDWVRGLPEYEWRLGTEKQGPIPRDYPQPLWDGSPLNGRRLLLYGEGGFGDTINFARYVPLVAQAGGFVILECRRELTDLFRSLPAGMQLVTRGESMPDFDTHLSLMSLPSRFGTTPETIPSRVPYLAADNARVEAFGRQMTGDGSEGKLRVGLAWAGSPTNATDRMRSLTLDFLGPLADVPDVRFYSLQVTPGNRLPMLAPEKLQLVDIAAGLHDFADTAAVISHLDLVISVDTAVAHLAGALAKPVFTFVPYLPDWRWMLGREDTPWYPTMRLFRQENRGDWAGPIRKAQAALAEMARQKAVATK